MLVKLVAGLAAWAAVCLSSWRIWPAMWVVLRALERMAVYTQEKGGSPMDAGGFFLGLPVADPGPLYYAVALPLRLSPLVLIGLLFWIGVAGARPSSRRGDDPADRPRAGRRAGVPAQEGRPLHSARDPVSHRRGSCRYR